MGYISKMSCVGVKRQSQKGRVGYENRKSETEQIREG